MEYILAVGVQWLLMHARCKSDNDDMVNVKKRNGGEEDGVGLQDARRKVGSNIIYYLIAKNFCGA